MTEMNWRENPVVQEVVLLAQHALDYAKKAPPIFDAVAGLVVLVVFALLIPLVLHIFFEGSLTPTGLVVDSISRAIGTIFQMLGVVGAFLCWGWATRGFLEQRRAKAESIGQKQNEVPAERP